MRPALKNEFPYFDVVRRAVPVFLLACIGWVSVGCVSKSQLEETQAELAQCQEDKARAEAAVVTWEERYDRESSRWNQLESAVSQALPKALGEFHEERDRILELVPGQVQDEVSGYLEDYFSTVMKGFELLSDDNAEIKLELRATQKALDAVGADARGIRTAVDQALTTERGKRDAMSGQLGDLAEYLGDVVSQVVEFDQTRINCRNCPDRLKLSRKEREALLAFHGELMSDLSDLQSRAAADLPAVVPPEEVMPSEEAAAGDGEIMEDEEPAEG